MKFKKIICTVFIILVSTALFATEIGDKVYMELEIDGDKVGKWVTLSAIQEFDANGWLIYENSFNEETRYERDKYGSKIYQKSPDGSEIWFEPKYNKNNKLIYRKSSTGIEEWLCTEEWYEYDSKGNCIHIKQSDGIEVWKEYDNKGNLVHIKRSNGLEFWDKYDKTGNTCISESSSGNVYIDKYEYYEDGKTLKKVMVYAYYKH